MAAGKSKPCAFCEIAQGLQPAHIVLDTPRNIAFLDIRPLLPGHLLLIPSVHVETFHDLLPDYIEELFSQAQRLSRAVQAALQADGAFLAVNTRVSQSVPHFHIHIVPRWKDDKLFSPKLVWKRKPYTSDAAAEETAASIRQALEREG